MVPLGAPRTMPASPQGFHRTHAPTPERQYFSPRCRSLGPKNLRTDSGKLARPQRKLCQTTCEHTTNDSKQSHAFRCGQDAGGRNTGPESCARAVVVARPPAPPPGVVPCEQNGAVFDGECGGSPPSRTGSTPPEGQTNGHRGVTMHPEGSIYTSVSSASRRPSCSSPGARAQASW